MTGPPKHTDQTPFTLADLRSDQNLGYLLYIGDGILPSHVGITLNQYKNPY